MATIKCRTKGNSSPNGKPRVYFTCHPEDFDRYFEKICEDIFKTHDCAIYYTEDMTAVIAEADKETDLLSNNLFIVPVTFRLLSRPNRAMDEDIPTAMQAHIPVVPFMMEPGLDSVYPLKFGDIQYLNPHSSDLTEIPYGEKLRKYLESTLISDELAKQVRAAFDAYIFLSYRKKDRRHANELMRLIHSHPACRDIAIWYDEFLNPAESFRENIAKNLEKSKLFALLVTPNLLEEPDGKPNFVMDKEYPAAHDSGIDILPAEMEKTDQELLGRKFPDIPPCVDPHDDETFRSRLLDSISRIAVTANDDDPMHNYLIGLAYLEGIDVENDRERGITLITQAAEADLPEAMKKLYRMYCDDKSVKLDYKEAAKWAERLVAHNEKTLGSEHPDTLASLNNLAITYNDLGDHQKALMLKEKVYDLYCKILGAEHPDTLSSLHNLAATYNDLGDYQKALVLTEKVYDLRCKVLGDEHPNTLTSLNNLAVTYLRLGDHQKALELKKKVYDLYCKILGAEHPDTLSSLNDLAATYSYLGNHQKALVLKEKVYDLRCKILGAEHPDTLSSLHNLAATYGDLGDHQKALALNEKVYDLYCKILGAEHPNTLISLHNLAIIYKYLSDYEKALELLKKVYELRCKVLGVGHPDTHKSLRSLTAVQEYLNDPQTSLAQKDETYRLRCKDLGAEHSDTLAALHDLAEAYGTLGNHQQAMHLYEKVYDLRCKVLGAEHGDTIDSLYGLALAYKGLREHKKALEVREQAYELACKIYGGEHPTTQAMLKNWGITYRTLGLCGHCGGKFRGLFRKTCSKCGKPKDY